MTGAARKTTAHTAAQLQEALGLSAVQLGMARAGGVIPAPDMKTPRWSGPVVDELVARREQLLAAVPDYATRTEVMTGLGLDFGDWRRAGDAGLIGSGGLIPSPDRGDFWSRPLLGEILARAEQIRAAIPPQPVGARRCAELLAELSGLPVEACDIEDLADLNLTSVVDWYKDWPLYDVAALHAVLTDPPKQAVLEQMVADRVAWQNTSTTAEAAAHSLGWSVEEFQRVAAARAIVAGRFGRYALTAIDDLRADADLDDEVRAERLLGANQATTYLEIRRTDFDYLTGGGLLVARTHVSVPLTRWRDITLPLYRTGDLDALKEHPGIDWEALHAVKAGQPSPLREIAHRRIDRAAIVRQWVAELGDRHGIEVWAWWHPGAGRWEIDFERTPTAPTVEQVLAELGHHPELGKHLNTGDLAVSTEAGAALRWARAMREPGRAVILDTETTDLDGYVIEVAVIDACTGETLLDTLINPRCPISEGARMVHGLSDADVAGAPTLTEVMPDLLRVTAGRAVLAYNASFDAGIITGHAHRDGLDPAHLGDPATWGCLMLRRSDWALRWRWLPLGGGHRALGDCQTAFELLAGMTAPKNGHPDRKSR